MHPPADDRHVNLYCRMADGRVECRISDDAPFIIDANYCALMGNAGDDVEPVIEAIASRLRSEWRKWAEQRVAVMTQTLPANADDVAKARAALKKAEQAEVDYADRLARVEAKLTETTEEQAR